MKAEVVDAAFALLLLTLSYSMWHLLAEERGAESFYVIEAAEAGMLCGFCFSFLCRSGSLHSPCRNQLHVEWLGYYLRGASKSREDLS